jgi:DNA-directed RNA polymerase
LNQANFFGKIKISINVFAFCMQDWFTECARLISGVCGQSVEWVSPLGLPVVQPYHRPVKKAAGEVINFGVLKVNPHEHIERLE